MNNEKDLFFTNNAAAQGHYAILGFSKLPDTVAQKIHNPGSGSEEQIANTLTSIATLITGATLECINSKKLEVTSDIDWCEQFLVDGSGSLAFVVFNESMEPSDGQFLLIPGSHYQDGVYAQQLNDELKKNSSAFGLPRDQMPAHTLIAKAGDIFAINPHIQHAIFNIKTPKHISLFTFK